MKIIISALFLSFSALAGPDKNWLMKQVWSNLSFTHYEVDAKELKKLVPGNLKIDTYKGRAFIGIVTLEMTSGNLNYLPLPLYQAFPQVNVRTYVNCKGKRGIYFISIDADHRLGSALAQLLFGLPYYKANINWEKNKNHYYMLSDAKNRNFEISFKPDDIYLPHDETTLPTWLTDIYYSYQVNERGIISETKLWHTPFQLQTSDTKIINDDIFQVLGINPIDSKTHTHYVGKTETYFWKNKKVDCRQ